MMNLAMRSSFRLIPTGFMASWPGVSRPSTTAVTCWFLAALGDAPGADHLDVVVHQAPRRDRIAPLDRVGEVAVGGDDVARHLGRERAVLARPGDVLERDELHHQHAVVRGLGDREVKGEARAREGVALAD